MTKLLIERYFASNELIRVGDPEMESIISKTNVVRSMAYAHTNLRTHKYGIYI